MITIMGLILKKQVCLTFILTALISQTIAQVSNNGIRNRLSLMLDAPPIASTTAKSSVEWNCINKALTNKCLVYHNDQWFDFIVPEPGPYFLNVSAQQCREKRGVQAIVIEGNPCEIKTYRILRCINQIRQDDVFIRLDSLKPAIPYLVNIDGFLGDFCDFKMQLATHPEGFPQREENPDTTLAPIYQGVSRFAIDWTVKKTRIEDFERFRVFRNKVSDVKSILVNEQSVKRNAYGAPELAYIALDSLDREGVYTYRVFGIHRETLIPHYLWVRQVTFIEPKNKLVVQQRIVIVPVSYPHKTILRILIYDRLTDKKLLNYRHAFDPVRNKSIEVYLGDLLDKGIKEFLILVSDVNEKQALEFYYSVNRRGELVKE